MTNNQQKSDLQKMFKDTICLLLITVIAGLILGFVYNLTKDPIEKQQLLKIQKACSSVYPEAGEFEEIKSVPSEKTITAIADAGYEPVDFGTTYMAKDNENSLLGYVITVTTHEGYGGDISFLLGVKLDGTVTGISILSISETPGLGLNADKILVPQFQQKNVAAFEYTKSGATTENQIDAISGATITTKAITNGVNSGLIFFREDLNKGGNAE